MSECLKAMGSACVRAVRLAALVVTALLIVQQPANSRSDESVLCDEVAAEASRRTGVPLSVLRAITRTETGRKRNGAFQPWPWTVNMEGKGVWFDTEDEARSYVYKEYRRGARSFDVGCFQINFRWHGQAFASIDEMFDPLKNALYAARFLKELHTEKGSWGLAAGAYHSRTPEFANRYQARFEKFRNAFAAEDEGHIPEIPDIVLAANTGTPDGEAPPMAARANTYPLLQTGGTTGLGSLVPLGNGSGASLFARQTPVSGIN